MELNFKKATIDDVQVISLLAEKIWKEHYISIITMEQINYMLDMMYSAESLSRQMNEGHEFTILYDINHQPIGYISISSADGKNYFLHKFYIDVSEHGKGLGSQLFFYVINQLPNPEIIELYVNRENYKSINFYFKHGFVIKEVINNDIGNNFYMNDFIMIKRFR